jgi:hypothetical protein
MPGCHHAFGPPVASLLLQIAPHAVATVMANLSRRSERYVVTGVEKLPTNVDVIARSCIDGIEPLDLEQSFFAKGHVASRDVLGAVVR